MDIYDIKYNTLLYSDINDIPQMILIDKKFNKIVDDNQFWHDYFNLHSVELPTNDYYHVYEWVKAFRSMVKVNEYINSVTIFNYHYKLFVNNNFLDDIKWYLESNYNNNLKSKKNYNCDFYDHYEIYVVRFVNNSYGFSFKLLLNNNICISKYYLLSLDELKTILYDLIFLYNL